MDTINSVLDLVQKDCFMAKIDIKDAYYSVNIHPDHQKFLKFITHRKLYKLLAV